MKKLLIISLLAVSFGALAQEDVISYSDDAVIVDLDKACWSKGEIQKCDLNKYGIDAILTYVSGSEKNAAGHYSQYSIASSVPIKTIDYKCEYHYSAGNYYCGVWNGSSLSGSAYVTGNNKSRTFDGNGVTSLLLKPNQLHAYQKLHFNNGIPTSLNASLSSAVSILRAAYVGVKRNMTTFKTEIAKSHRGHLDRFAEALDVGIQLTSAKDEKSQKPLYSIVNWRIQENARLVVVFGSVLNELLTDYDDVERLKTSISAMRVLVEQLRLAYGWEKGLAGTISKASSSLIEVVRLELQELASIKMAMGSGEFQIYMDLLKVTRNLQAKVDASRSGDMKAQREIFDLVDLWNGQLWQAELGRLLNAGPDFKNLVIPKLSMLLYAVESIADLSEQDFVMPDRSTLK